MKTVLRAAVVFGAFALATMCAAGQDLGSSNKLFGGPSAKSGKKKSFKRVVPKRYSKAGTPKRASARSGQTSASKRTKPANNATEQPAKIMPKASPAPVSAADAALYEKLIDQGNLARDERKYAVAQSIYTRAQTIKPSDARAIYGLANLYSDLQRWEDAEAAYRSALELDAKNAFIYIALSYVLSQPIFVSDLGTRYEEAEKLARRAIELDPSNPLAFDQLGVSMELRGLVGSDTENMYRNAIRIDPAFAPSYAHLGRLLRRRGMIKPSAAAYADAVRHATDVPTMILVADVMQSEQRFADSEPLLQKAIAEDPRNPTALFLLGRALTTMGNYADAERMLRRSLDVSPNGFVANLQLSSLFARQGKYELAENALLQAMRFVSQSERKGLAQQFEAVGDGYMRNGKSSNAARAYRQAMALDAEKESLAPKLARAQHG